MELAFLVYGISLLTSFSTIAALGVVVAAVLATILFINSSMLEEQYTSNLEASESSQYEETKTRYKLKADRLKKKIDSYYSNSKRFSALAIISMMFVALVPSEKTAWIMVGAYATQRVVTSPSMQETGDKVIKIINNKLDEYLVEGIKK